MSLASVINEIYSDRSAFEAVAERHLSFLLQRTGPSLTELCSDIEARLSAQTTAAATRVPTVREAFVDVFCLAVYAALAKLAPPLAWLSARESHMAERRLPLAVASATTHAATVVQRTCEHYLLSSPVVARQLFQLLLEGTGMGVPLLSVVLQAYGVAVVDVLCGSPPDSRRDAALTDCLAHLRVATEAYVLGDAEKNHLTIAHAAYLHVARVGGRTDDALRFYQQQPIRFVNPIVSGVGLSDYVSYYSEAALLLASQQRYASAFYALTPVHSLPPGWGLAERQRSRALAAEGVDDAVAATAAFKTWGASDGRGEAASTAARHTSNNNDNTTNTSSSSSSSPANANADGLYAASATVLPASAFPFYRTSPVSATHTVRLATPRSEQAGETVVEWRLILAPTPAEVHRDRQIRAWALRLSVLLLSIAFGGGNPRAVGAASSREESDWRGVPSPAIPSHVCFPHPVFYHLSQSTRVSLEALLNAVEQHFSPESRVYLSLLRAVARRDVCGAQAVLANASSAATLEMDMTHTLAAVAVMDYLPRHVLLDVTRMYARVPLRLLIDRTAQGTDSAGEAQQAREVLRALAGLCASGELQECRVCVREHGGDGATPTTESTGDSVCELVGSSRLEQASMDAAATTVSFTTPSISRYLQLCARLVVVVEAAPQMGGDDAGSCHEAAGGATANVSLLQMLRQLTALQEALDTELATARAIR